MRSAILAVLALAAVSVDAQAQVSGSFDVEVEISQASGDGYVAQFRVSDAVSHRLIAEPMLPFAATMPASFNVGATPARECTSGTDEGYCIDFFAGADSAAKSALYAGFITRAGELLRRTPKLAGAGR